MQIEESTVSHNMQVNSERSLESAFALIYQDFISYLSQ